MFPENEGVFEFYIMAIPPGAWQWVHLPVQLIVQCVPESNLVFADNSQLIWVLDVLKNTGVQNYWYFLDEEDIYANYDLADRSRCRLTSTEVYHSSNRTLVESGDLLYDKLALDVKNRSAYDSDADEWYYNYKGLYLDTFYMENYTVANIPYRFTVRYEAKGGAYIDQDFMVNLIICEWEDVELQPDADRLDDGDDVLFIELHTDELKVRNYPLPPLFNTNDTDCPPIDFRLKEMDWYWYYD